MNALLLLVLFSAAVAKVAGIPIAGEGAGNQGIVILCPEKEMWFDCGPCDGTCSNLRPACPMMCRPGGRSGCGCIEGHVRDEKGRGCIPHSQCQTVEPGSVHQPEEPAELRPGGPADIHHPEEPAELRPGGPADIHQPEEPAELRPGGPADIHQPEEPANVRPPGQVPVQPPVCPDKEMWFPCGTCDGSCSELKPMCPRVCKSQGSCGCIADHVRDPKAGNCIHVSTCAQLNPVIPP